MNNKNYKEILFEKELVDTLENIYGFEDIFLDFGEKRDAKKLIELYDTYLEMTKFEGPYSFDAVKRKKDLISYLEKRYNVKRNFLDKLRKEWKEYV